MERQEKVRTLELHHSLHLRKTNQGTNQPTNHTQTTANREMEKTRDKKKQNC